MRVLVTGGAGFIGSHVCKRLAEAGHIPVAYDNLRTGHRWAVRWGPFEHGDISDPVRLLEVLRAHRIDVVMHFAALAYVGESVSQPDIYWMTNVARTLTMIETIRAAGIERMVFSSSCATYGVAETATITETSPQAPISPYGRSKLAIEHVLQDYADAFGFSSIALRYFNAAGSDPDGEIGEEHDPETHVIPLILQTAAGRRERFTLLGDDYPTADGTCVRDFVHVFDLAEAHALALEAIKPGCAEAYNLGTGEGFSVAEVIDVARLTTGRPIAVEVAVRRPGDPPTLTADASLAKAELGWTPQRSDLATMIGDTWRWMTEHRARVGFPVDLGKRW
ncbi:UDP-glucose 4-epimerase [Stappia sp. 22II-S9-Z10]|nr:UDP-glucose 4-epimerase [Stappia sp. 22II-S9-Z10]